jgi:hypothetical protein
MVVFASLVLGFAKVASAGSPCIGDRRKRGTVAESRTGSL